MDTEKIKHLSRHEKERLLKNAKNIYHAKLPDNIIPTVQIEDKTKGFLLSFNQQQLWILNKLEKESSSYYISFGFRLTGKLNWDMSADIYNDSSSRKYKNPLQFPIL